MLLKSQIASILYQNGTVETFDAETEKPVDQPAATSVPASTVENTWLMQPHWQPVNILAQM
jgi:hypothetical protein